MSKIYEYGGVLIHVWPKDHSPVHCHVYVDGFEIKVFLPDFVVELVKDRQNPIGKEWRRLHGN